MKYPVMIILIAGGILGIMSAIAQLNSAPREEGTKASISLDSCTDNRECSEGQYCAKATGDCDGMGTCIEKPEACIPVWDPVCGCDGKTYSNACYAALASVNVDHEGECITTCTDNSTCSNGEFCQKNIGDCDGMGTCVEKPEACIPVWDPVCGCDGKTYSNACYAALAGVNVEYDGECASTCSTNSECGADEYCRKTTGDCEGKGTCLPKPLQCADIWNPVCGCNGMTYDNTCFAAAVGVNVNYAGECVDIPCTSNVDCSEDEFCSKKVGNCNGAGTCQPKPEVCPEVWDPVCGCDGQTYGNSCLAAASGVNVDYEGECIAFQRGDVNRDGNINVLDMITVANHILHVATLDSTGQYLADCNGDNSINVLDLIAIANVIIHVFDRCPGNRCKPVINSEVLDLLKAMESYFPHEEYHRLMALVKTVEEPETYSLAQNFPNPFNPETDIRYGIANVGSRAHVTLRIFNILGQEVRALVNEVQERGVYTVTWDGRDNPGNLVPSGVYLYRLTVNHGLWSETKRMVLMR